MLRLARANLFARGPTGTMARAIVKRAVEWNLLTLRIMLRAAKDRDVVSAACNDYLMYSGYAIMGHFWLKQALVANEKLAKGGKDSAEFYKAKVQTAEFYFERMLPRADGHKTSMLATTSSLMQMDAEHFNFH